MPGRAEKLMPRWKKNINMKEGDAMVELDQFKC